MERNGEEIRKFSKDVYYQQKSHSQRPWRSSGVFQVSDNIRKEQSDGIAKCCRERNSSDNLYKDKGKQAKNEKQKERE